MLLRNSFLRGLAAAVIAVSLATLAFGDTIRLKDGSIIKGKIVGFSGGTFIITVGEGPRARRLTFTAAEVDSIQFDSPMSQPETERRNDIPTVVITNPTTRPTPLPMPASSPEPVAEVIEDETSDPEPDVSEPDTEIPVSTPASTQGNRSEPIGLEIKVLADNTSNGWTNTGWIVRKGQRIRVIGKGEVGLGSGNTTNPSGLADLNDQNKLLQSVPTGALIAVIGDDNNDFIYIGAERTFTASRDGALFLGLNEGNLNDNTGSFDVRVEIDPGTE